MPAEGGFSFANLAILLVVVIVVVPLYRRLRVGISTRRRTRWAAEDAAYRAAVDGEGRGDG